MIKLLVVIAVAICAGIIDVSVDRAVGADLSHLSIPKRLFHIITYKLTGAAIVATIFFA